MQERSKLKVATSPVSGADNSTAAVPVLPAVPLFLSMFLAPPTIPIATIIDNTSIISNDVSGVNNEMIDNVILINECEDKGEIGEVDDFESLDINFHDANKISMFSPSSKKTKISDTDDTFPKQKRQNYTREEDIVLCRSFINLSKNAMEGAEKNWKSGEMCISYLVS